MKSGPDSELEAFWNKMVLAGNAVNKANVSYAFAGPNSNTVATTRLQAASFHRLNILVWTVLPSYRSRYVVIGS